MDWTQWLTLVLAVVGSGLGVFNTWRAVARDRVKLKVEPGRYLNKRGEPMGLCIVVVNLGATTVTIKEIGLRAADSDTRFIPTIIRFSGCSGLPHRLESRAEITVYFSPGADEHPGLAGADHAYARTACGHTSIGRNEVLARMLNDLRLAAEAPPPIDE